MWRSLSAGIVLCLCGCAPSVERLRARAAFDLQCHEEQLQIFELDSRTRGVAGCGRRGTYVYSCGAGAYGMTNCSWVANTSSGVPIPEAQTGASDAGASAAASVYVPAPPPKPEDDRGPP